MRDLTNPDEFEALLGERVVILLKHGQNCPISRAARQEIAAFCESHPEADVCAVEVTGQRALSDDIAERLAVRHASPQLLVLRDGRVAWRAEHFNITRRALESALAA